MKCIMCRPYGRQYRRDMRGFLRIRGSNSKKSRSVAPSVVFRGVWFVHQILLVGAPQVADVGLWVAVDVTHVALYRPHGRQYRRDMGRFLRIR